MSSLDWILLALPLLIVFWIGWQAHRHMRGVAQFLSGGRFGGRYLLAVAKGEMLAGAVVFVMSWEIFAKAGFVPSWWGWMSIPVGLIVTVSGFVTYRYRETKSFTLAQFFEMRYSRRFRLFTGMVGFLAGMLNFGIIPAVGARFLVYFLQLPPEFSAAGWMVPTFVPLMGVLLAVSLTLTLSGGMVTLMVTDCVEGIISQLAYLAIIAAVLLVVGWGHIESVLLDRPPGHSMFNPFDAWKVQDFNLWYALMAMFVGVYGTMAWQNASAYNSAAATPHEGRMAAIIGRWREAGKHAVVVLLAAGGLAFLNHPDFADAAATAHAAIDGIVNPQLQKQMEIPIALSHLLPEGIKGILCAVLLMGIFGGDSTHLHSWGGILAQDVIIPLRKRPPGSEDHIRLLRRCIIAVAVFAFLFGALFQQTEYIIMWFQITTAIYVGGAGAAIIGGLYWRRGTTAGAWAAMLTGSILSTSGVLASKLIDGFPLNGMQMSFFATLIAIAVYVIVSLATCRKPFDLEAMLHRVPGTKPPAAGFSWGRIMGFNSQFSRADCILASAVTGWGLLWFFTFLVGTIWNIVVPWPDGWWPAFWRITGVGIPVLMAVFTGIWFTWGGIRDIRALFRNLRAARIDNTDNGIISKSDDTPE